MKEKGGKIFRTFTIICTIFLVFIIVTGCVDFSKMWSTIAGIFGTAGASIRNNVDTVIKVALLIAVGGVIGYLLGKKK